MTIDITKLYSLVTGWMTLILTEGHWLSRKLEQATIMFYSGTTKLYSLITVWMTLILT